VNFNTDLRNRNDTIDQLNRKIAELSKIPDIVAMTASPVLGLNDLQRWKNSNSLRGQTLRQGRVECHLIVATDPESPAPNQIWPEIIPLLNASGWTVEGSHIPKTFFPAAFAVSVAKDEGYAFNCGYRLSEFLQQLHIKEVTFKSSVTSPDLLECKEDNCVQMTMGNVVVEKR
jgi:hypothetical protein